MDNVFKEFVESTLRKYALAEGKNQMNNVSVWWEKLPGKLRKRVAGILGFSKGKDNAIFSELSPGERSDVEAYFVNHNGRVEDRGARDIGKGRVRR